MSRTRKSGSKTRKSDWGQASSSCFLMFLLPLKDLNYFILILRNATFQIVQCGKLCDIIYAPQF